MLLRTIPVGINRARHPKSVCADRIGGLGTGRGVRVSAAQVEWCQRIAEEEDGCVRRMADFVEWLKAYLNDKVAHTRCRVIVVFLVGGRRKQRVRRMTGGEPGRRVVQISQISGGGGNEQDVREIRDRRSRARSRLIVSGMAQEAQDN